MLRLTLAALLAGSALPAIAADAPAPSRLFTGADLFDLEQADDPQISPDGSQVAYVRKSADIMTDRGRSTIWIVDVRTGAQQPLVATPGSHTSPRWSADGKRLAYVSAADGASPQIYVRWMANGQTARVTGLPDSPGAITWSPDGRQIAYVMRVPGDATTLGKAPAKPEGAKWAEPLEVIDRVTYRADGGGYLKPGHDHIFVVAADGGAPRQITSGSFDDGGPLSWSKDGRTILFSAVRGVDWEREPNDSDIYAVDVASGQLSQLTKRYGADAQPTLSPDGKLVAYIGANDKHRSFTHNDLYVMNRDGSGARSLTATLDRDIESVRWAKDGHSLFVDYDDHAKKRVARATLDGRVTMVVDGLAGGGLDRPYTGGSFTVSDDNKVAYTGGTAARPADLFVNGRQLTHLNDTTLAYKTLGRMQPLSVKAPDGRAIDSWLVLPPGYRAGTRVPLILEIHGGPHTAYGPTFSADYQLYAAGGYAVLYTNPRGSTSYGDEFANLIDKKYPGEDYDDLMAAVDTAIASGVADPNNLFVTGGSGGGVLTSWIVGKNDRFKAAATQKPVINWISEALTMDGTGFTSRYWFAKQPWEDPMGYWNRSPLSLVGNVKTPTLVVVGSEDYRTPVSESEQYYAALQIRGVPTAMVKVPGASHGGIAARPSQAAAKAAAILAWFDRYRTGTATNVAAQ
ncbi:S9 family peptidase [uncultured Sphingomonas sp.]|uniref:alpha/beta hydrolase family protein n=1 Tax=uncultured Sphingomonas sp. TaxID=158754 RepID=UPI0025D5ACB8|nr:S9 family peptidase [uncultured Sphingomonas sp.]